MSQQDRTGQQASIGNVKVVCRFRPLNEKEKAMGVAHVHQFLDDKTVAIKDKDKEPLNFNFDKAFNTNTPQEEVYNYAAASVIDSVIEGFNGTIFAYGQTSSGKTHTMEGQIAESVTPQSGIIPRMIKHVFDSISNSSENIQFRIKISLVELYNEKLRDLLDASKIDLKIRSDKKRGIFIEEITQKYISSQEEVYELIKIAQSSRAIASTNMNERSSRSHMIFILTISQNNIDDLSAKTGKLYLVDLAGSEKIGKTGAEGKVLDEAKKINASLTVLGKVINALTDGKSTHIPYRDSKLTRVLQQSLGGNSKTTLIVTCSPHPNNVSETLSTLRFGISAKKIKNKPKINKELTVAELQNLLQKAEKTIADRDQYINQLKSYIQNDLKKPVPEFQTQKSMGNFENEQTENVILSQLQRQLQNMRSVHQEQINSYKSKCELLFFQKQQMQKQMQKLKADNQVLLDKQSEGISQSQQPKQQSVSSVQIDELIKQLQKLTTDSSVIELVKSKASISSSPEEHGKLLQNYELEKEKRQKSEDQLAKYQKSMQKKLMQLQNNICQLTHAYYDLVVVQQRYKVDNIFLKKNLDDKQSEILLLKKQIQELIQQNKSLENIEYGDEEDETIKLVEKGSKKYELEESSKQFEQAIERRNQQIHHNPKVVKVLKGGLK